MSPPLLGRMNRLKALAPHGSGFLLDGGDEFGEVLLPKRYVPESLRPGEEIEVFLSLDSEDRPVATTDRPLAMAGDFAFLKVIASTRVGSFLDWGMPKDLLLPFGEQVERVRVGQRVLVYILVDQVSGRLVASTKLKKFVSDTAPPGVHAGNRVDLLVAAHTDIGTLAIVDDRYWGLLHRDDTPRTPALGSRCKGYIRRIRDEDGRVDLSLEEPGYGKIPAAAAQLLARLKEEESGGLPLHDKSPPDEIREVLGMSKKVFKQAVGALYKAGQIRIEADGIHLV